MKPSWNRYTENPSEVVLFVFSCSGRRWVAMCVAATEEFGVLRVLEYTNTIIITI